MKRNLESFADKGCWISHDRIYAFISAEHGITEVGYHGRQPVSRNSRILVLESGVLAFSVRAGNKEIPLQTNVVNWQATQVQSETALPEGMCSLLIIARGRTLSASCSSALTATAHCSVRLAKQSLYSEVHGERTWSPFHLEGSAVVVKFRDRIMLQQWIRRTGPYAGDFMIPETVRHKIFKTVKRSGLATRDDLRPEFRNTDLPLYDAEEWIRFGGEGWSIHETTDAFVFERDLEQGESVEFSIRCSDTAEIQGSEINKPARQPVSLALTLPGFPHVEEFTGTVSGLVDSCIVHDHGIPRACPGRYYWIWAWDALVTMNEALRWGDHAKALQTAQFIEHHRDVNGRIPARWTRSLQPLDTPSPGGIEFLQASLVYEIFLETNDEEILKQFFPSFKTLFEASERQLLREGLIMGEGFYPDLLSAFGRTADSAVCMEVGSWYAFCRILENIARRIGDHDLEERTTVAAAAIAEHFGTRFWDEEAGFVLDSVDPGAGGRSRFHPLFALLFLQSPPGLTLIRPHLRASAAFIAREFVTDAGIRVVPSGESGTSGEDVLDAWYPHWDFYALRILRRAGDAASIMRWLAQAETALSRLGYCPEFLSLNGFRENAADKWERHGSASNLNGVTAWSRTLRESIAGFEFGPGGITHIPLSLPLPEVRMEELRYRGGSWTIETKYGGPRVESFTVDGTVLEGCMKIPSSFYTKGDHRVSVRYGNRPSTACFMEIVNAKVLSSKRLADAVEAEIEPLGFVEVVVFSPEEPLLLINGRPTPVNWDRNTGTGWGALTARSICTLRMERT